MRRVAAALLTMTAAFTLGSCAPEQVPAPPRLGCSPALTDQDDDIREVVLRNLIGSFLEERGRRRYLRSIHVIFVGVDGGPDPWSEFFGWDPSTAFLSRFRDIDFPVKALSASRLGDEARDRNSGEAGVVFSAGAICWVGPGRVEVKAGRWFDMMGGAGYSYTLRQRAGKWVLDSRELEWVS